jgi:hypothetical protein
MQSRTAAPIASSAVPAATRPTHRALTSARYTSQVKRVVGLALRRLSFALGMSAGRHGPRLLGGRAIGESGIRAPVVGRPAHRWVHLG